MTNYYFVDHEIDYERETMELIFRMVNGESYELLKADLARRLGIKESGRVDELLNKLSEVEERMRPYIDVSNERVLFYFKTFAGDDICRANILCQGASYMKKEDSLEKQKQQLVRYLKEIATDDTLELILTKNDLQVHHYEDETTYTLLERMEQLECEDAVKWSILYLINHAEELVEELFTLIEPIKAKLKEFEMILSPLMEQCAAYWEEYFKTETIQILIGNFYGVAENSYEEMVTYIRPQIMKCDYVLFYGNDETMGDYHIMEIGIAFDKNYRAKKCRMTNEQICNGLKLLSDHSKFEILKQINGTKAYGQELASKLNLSTATISHHMNSLMEFGFITIEKKEKKIYYTMNQGAIQDFMNLAMEELIGEKNKVS